MQLTPNGARPTMSQRPRVDMLHASIGAADARGSSRHRSSSTVLAARPRLIGLPPSASAARTDHTRWSSCSLLTALESSRAGSSGDSCPRLRVRVRHVPGLRAPSRRDAIPGSASRFRSSCSFRPSSSRRGTAASAPACSSPSCPAPRRVVRYLEPIGELSIQQPADLLALVLFGAVGALIASLSDTRPARRDGPVAARLDCRVERRCDRRQGSERA